MKVRNRLFAILLALAMVITYMPGLAYALEGQPDANPAAGETLDGPEEAGETLQDNGQAVPAADQAGAAEVPAGEAAEVEGDENPTAPEAEPAAGEVQDPVEDKKSGEEGSPVLSNMTLKPISVTPDVELVDSDELLWGFLNKELPGGETPSKKSALKSRKAPRGDQLEGYERNIFEYLKAQIEDFTDPEEAATLENAVFDIDLSVVLGHELERVMVNGNEETYEVTPDEMETLQSLDLDAVVSALLADMPYELFWFDKSVDGSTSLVSKFGSYYEGDEGEYLFIDSPGLEISFKVSADYSADGSRNTTAFNLEKINSVKTAINDAKGIIEDENGSSDYEKLVAYKGAICERTSYNQAAADDPDTAYGDPWQMIYVFDGKESTNVVCEGYSKAFQYLCDHTEFENDTDCITVSGIMTGGTGAGRHMWNIVSLDDSYISLNYIADVTNSDAGSIGYEGGLFISPAMEGGSVEEGYSFDVDENGTADVTYQYNDNTKNLYSESELRLSARSYGQERIALEKLFFDGVRAQVKENGEGEWAHFYSVDGQNGTISLEDMNVSVQDANGDIVDPDDYDIEVYYCSC